MSSVTEIESAIEKLGSEEFEELLRWCEQRRIQSEAKRHEAKRCAIESTGGYLTGDDEDFVTAVAEAGLDTPCIHEW